MDQTLKKIKRAILAQRYQFSLKALIEMDADGLAESDALESILTAVDIYKTIRSTNPQRYGLRERLHIIIGTTLDGTPVYTKGKLVALAGVETYYFLVSSKRALR